MEAVYSYVQGSCICTGRQNVYTEAVCVHGSSMCTWRQYMYKEAEYVHGGSICTWRQYMYMEAIYGDNICTWRQCVPPIYCHPPTRLHRAITQKGTIWTPITVRNSGRKPQFWISQSGELCSSHGTVRADWRFWKHWCSPYTWHIRLLSWHTTRVE